ncbi:MAG: nucleoside-diphosphate sugar epimerase/dehydratase [Thermodesulfobacteriota bacterium]
MDLGLILAAHALAYLLRFEGGIPSEHLSRMTGLLPLLAGVKLACFFSFRLYRGMWRYTSLPDLMNVLKAVTAASLMVVGYLVVVHRFAGYSRSVFLLDWVFTMALVAGLRVGIRMVYGLGMVHLPAMLRNAPPGPQRRVVLLGAGEAGEKMVREVKGSPRSGLAIAAIFDDDPATKGRLLHGIPVFSPISALPAWMASGEAPVSEALLAIPSLSGDALRRVVDLCDKSGLPCRRIPSLSEIARGRVTVKDLRDVDYRDLLGRQPAQLDPASIAGYLKGRTVLVTGAGGSIGSELCRQILAFEPGRLLLLDASESNLYAIQMELEHERGFTAYLPLLGSLTDRAWTDWVLDAHRPDVIFHAAAYKHVPMLEDNPWQAVANNILATAHLVGAAVERRVDRLLVVSTDKAVRPTNVMGASKRLTERIMQAHCGRGTRLSAVRFGNVIGSAGSVVPLFRRQIERGGPLTVTHPEVTRYFMTIEEACQLILQAGSMGDAGEIFVLRMGQPVRIADMAADLIRLSGKEPGADIEIKFIGLRPGEKLYEELITAGEDVVPTGHSQIMVLQGSSCGWDELTPLLGELDRAAQARDASALREALRRAVPEYAPDKAGQPGVPA